MGKKKHFHKYLKNNKIGARQASLEMALQGGDAVIEKAPFLTTRHLITALIVGSLSKGHLAMLQTEEYYL